MLVFVKRFVWLFAVVHHLSCSFFIIIQSRCVYVEFPLCDVLGMWPHFVLYLFRALLDYR